MLPGDYLILIGARRFQSGCSSDMARRARYFIRFKDIEVLEFLIEDGQRLEALGFDHLAFEPILDFILLYLFQIFVIVVKMPKHLERKPFPAVGQGYSPIEL